jgi:hypothetical protein
MSTATQDQELAHPAARATHALYEAAGIAHSMIVSLDFRIDGLNLSELLCGIAEDVAAIYQDNEAKATELAEQREELCRMAQYIVRLEEANTRHVIAASDLKTRLARAAENNEELYRLTSHAVGDATERHLIVARNRALLDLEIPVPPVRSAAISTPTHYGAPRAAATH